MKILFQGDSITDWGRDRVDPHILGQGYPFYTAKLLTERFPDTQFEFINLGISGNRTCDLVGRLQSDFIDVKADLITILIGVNDTWQHYSNNDFTTPEQFEANYRTVLDAVKKTGAKIIVLEQFSMPAPATELFREDIDVKIDITRKLALEYADVFLPLDGMFAAACVQKDREFWSFDGVHPAQGGIDLIAEKLADAISGFVG